MKSLGSKVVVIIMSIVGRVSLADHILLRGTFLKKKRRSKNHLVIFVVISKTIASS